MELNQKRRLTIIGALLILHGVSIYQFGFKMLLITGVAIAASLIVELLATKLRKEKYDFTSYFISPLVISLIITHHVYDHVWMIGLGIAFGIFFAKSLFGGQDKNIFNPVALGIIFMLLSFPTYLLNTNTGNASGELFVYVTLALALLLMTFKVLSPYMLLTYLLSLVGIYGVFNLINSTNPSINFILFNTHMVFVGVFMGTEKSSGAKHKIGQVIYGLVLALLVWLINTQSSNTEFAAIYAILLINALAPQIDSFVDAYLVKPEASEEVLTWRIL